MKTCCVLLLVVGSASAQTAQQSPVVKSVRQYALNYTRNLPNYTCTLTTRQSIHPTASVNLPALRLVTMEEQLSFVDNHEIHRTQRIDGVPVAPDAGERLPGTSSGEFGNLLAIIFDPASGADIRFDRVSTLNRRRVDMLTFRVPQPSGYILTEPRRVIRVPFEGTVYADAESHAVVRIRMKVFAIPFDSMYQALDLTLDYKAARVAGAEFILPSHFELNYRTDRVTQQSNSDYTNYRRFSAETTVTFEDDSK